MGGVFSCSYRSVEVDAAITVETKWLTSSNVGFATCILSTAILFNAVLSSTTTASAHCVNLLIVSKLLYGCTTTSEFDVSCDGKTE